MLDQVTAGANLRAGAKKKYVERFDRYDKASIAKWLAGVVDRSAQEQEDAQDLLDEISDSDNPRAGQAFSQLLKDHISNMSHIMKWALKKLENVDSLVKQDTPDSKAETSTMQTAPAV
jgi:flagellar hook-basal body complex protein FliE